MVSYLRWNSRIYIQENAVKGSLGFLVRGRTASMGEKKHKAPQDNKVHRVVTIITMHMRPGRGTEVKDLGFNSRNELQFT